MRYTDQIKKDIERMFSDPIDPIRRGRSRKRGRIDVRLPLRLEATLQQMAIDDNESLSEFIRWALAVAAYNYIKEASERGEVIDIDELVSRFQPPKSSEPSK